MFYSKQSSCIFFCIFAADDYHHDILEYGEEAEDDFSDIDDAILIAGKIANLCLWIIIKLVAVLGNCVRFVNAKGIEQASTSEQHDSFVSARFDSFVEVCLLSYDTEQHHEDEC